MSGNRIDCTADTVKTHAHRPKSIAMQWIWPKSSFFVLFFFSEDLVRFFSIAEQTVIFRMQCNQETVLTVMPLHDCIRFSHSHVCIQYASQTLHVALFAAKKSNCGCGRIVRMII